MYASTGPQIIDSKNTKNCCAIQIANATDAMLGTLHQLPSEAGSLPLMRSESDQE
jgi:hypothetical protein